MNKSKGSQFGPNVSSAQRIQIYAILSLAALMLRKWGSDRTRAALLKDLHPADVDEILRTADEVFPPQVAENGPNWQELEPEQWATIPN